MRTCWESRIRTEAAESWSVIVMQSCVLSSPGIVKAVVLSSTFRVHGVKVLRGHSSNGFQGGVTKLLFCSRILSAR